MANTKSAKKAVRTIARRHDRNTAVRSAIKTVVKRAREAIKSGNQTAEAVRVAESLIDKAVTKGIVHRNKAARQKSRLARHRNEAAAKA